MATDDLSASLRQPGIYRIRHTASGRVYVGSSINVYVRWISHRTALNRGKHHSRHLQSAWNKYGQDSFVFELIQSCSTDELIRLETSAIAAAQAADQRYGYNLAPVAGSVRGIKRTEEHKAKIGAAHKGRKASEETRARLSASLTGRHMSPEWCAKIAKANTGRKMLPLTEEHRAIVSSHHKGKTISDAQKKRVSETHKGKKHSPEFIKKRADALRAYHQRKRGLISQQFKLAF